MLGQIFDTFRSRPPLVLGAMLLLCSVDAAAAPRITEVMNSVPPHASVGEKVLFAVEALVPPVLVFFSNGTSPTLEATGVQYDAARGFLIAQVPVGAQTGNIKVKANGADSPPHYFRIDAGVYAPGSDTVQGTVTGPGGPVQGAMLALLRPTACEEMDFIDLTVSGAAGEYTLHGPDGNLMIFAFPPTAGGLAAGTVPVTLGASPVTVPVGLTSGTTVNGRVVRAASPATGVANARVDFEGGGYETRLTDAGGYFSAVLAPGSATMRSFPSPADALARDERPVTIGVATPQSLANTALDGGVRIYGFVRRTADSLPLPGVRLSVWPQDSCCGNRDQKTAGGDGSYALVVPANHTYQMNSSADQDAPFVDANLQGIVVGAADVHQDVNIQDAGAITGTILDAVTGDPVAQLGVQAFDVPYTGSTLAYARTCADGSYRLRVPPNATGYVAGAAFYEVNGYVSVAWNGTVGGTFYPCEGTLIPVPTAATTASGIDLHLHSGAAAVSGNVFSQASGCSAPMGGTNGIFVDDGTGHSCGLGSTDWAAPAGTYRVVGLPGADLVPALRVCHPGVSGGAQQCWNTARPPSYSPVVVASHGEATGINFCLGAVPTRAVSGVRATKSGGSVTFSWTATDDPYQSQYRLRGAIAARPASGTGSFPNDPSFDFLWSGLLQSASVPLTDPRSFFLVTNAGMSGVEGPSGSYGH
jgi:hypothetical protein